MGVSTTGCIGHLYPTFLSFLSRIFSCCYTVSGYVPCTHERRAKIRESCITAPLSKSAERQMQRRLRWKNTDRTEQQKKQNRDKSHATFRRLMKSALHRCRISWSLHRRTRVVMAAYYMRASYAGIRYCFWRCLSVCLSVFLSSQNLQNYWPEIDVTR